MFIVRTRDAFGNDRASGGDAVSATLMQAGTAEVVHVHVQVEVGGFVVQEEAEVVVGHAEGVASQGGDPVADAAQ